MERERRLVFGDGNEAMEAFMLKLLSAGMTALVITGSNSSLCADAVWRACITEYDRS